jgi:hypothetical protein
MSVLEQYGPACLLERVHYQSAGEPRFKAVRSCCA